MLCILGWQSESGNNSIKTLGHTGMAASFVPPEGNSLDQAKAKADLIVKGTVLSLRPHTSRIGHDVTIAVSHVHKGQAANTIVVDQLSYLEPRDNWQSMIILDASNAPLLLPGESVFLFLKSTHQGLTQLSYTGVYYERAGRIEALELNTFASKVNGLRADDFAAAIASA